jgi:hypothetical protein
MLQRIANRMAMMNARRKFLLWSSAVRDAAQVSHEEEMEVLFSEAMAAKDASHRVRASQQIQGLWHVRSALHLRGMHAVARLSIWCMSAWMQKDRTEARMEGELREMRHEREARQQSCEVLHTIHLTANYPKFMYDVHISKP